MIRNFSKGLSLFLLCIISCSSPTLDSTIDIRIDQDPESLHPLNAENASALQILNHVYQSLLTIDLTDNSIQPLLASELPKVQKIGNTSYFTFTIRPEARWDNGLPVTSADVAFSLKLLHSPLLENERWRAQYSFIEDIKISANSPLEFTLSCQGYSPEMRLLSGDFFVLPEYLFDPKGVLKTIPYSQILLKFDSLSKTSTFESYAAFINQAALARDTAYIKGSGPYKLVNWNPGQLVSLKKKQSWWGSDVKSTNTTLRAVPNDLAYHVIPDNAAAIMALKSKQVDVMDNIPLVAFQEMRTNEKYRQLYNFYTPTSYELAYIGINGNNSLLQDKLTRQALAHLIHVPQVIKSIQGGMATPTVGFVHPQDNKYYNGEVPLLDFNRTKAKNLLKSAGWEEAATGWRRIKKGKNENLKLELIYRAGNTDFENAGLLFQQNAKSIGVDLVLTAMESSQIGERLQQRNFDLFLSRLVGNPFSYNLLPLLHTSNATAGGANVTSFGTPQTDRLLEKIAITDQEKEKSLLLKELQKKMQEESNLVFLYFQQNKIAISKKIDSVVVSGITPGYDVTKFTMKK